VFELHIGGPIGLLVLVFDVYAIMQIARSRYSGWVRAAWIALILVLPIIGFLIWLFVGPREGRGIFR
jgi:hypothetical protein